MDTKQAVFCRSCEASKLFYAAELNLDRGPVLEAAEHGYYTIRVLRAMERPKVNPTSPYRASD